ncbi:MULTISPECIES: hypothetical protein [unclassified Microbacterium]|uniref:hypothetical protein n=1 Tax=unclassified Microbacterium TaxID=2609290 RepID=UPI00301B047F
MSTATGPTPVTITVREVYDLLLEVRDSVAIVPTHADTLKDHETRIRAQEARRTVSPRDLWTGIIGAASAGAAIASIIQAVIK